MQQQQQHQALVPTSPRYINGTFNNQLLLKIDQSSKSFLGQDNSKILLTNSSYLTSNPPDYQSKQIVQPPSGKGVMGYADELFEKRVK